jgi:hypothetical protein
MPYLPLLSTWQWGYLYRRCSKNGAHRRKLREGWKKNILTFQPFENYTQIRPCSLWLLIFSEFNTFYQFARWMEISAIDTQAQISWGRIFNYLICVYIIVECFCYQLVHIPSLLSLSCSPSLSLSLSPNDNFRRWVFKCSTTSSFRLSEIDICTVTFIQNATWVLRSLFSTQYFGLTKYMFLTFSYR